MSLARGNTLPASTKPTSAQPLPVRRAQFGVQAPAGRCRPAGSPAGPASRRCRGDRARSRAPWNRRRRRSARSAGTSSRIVDDRARRSRRAPGWPFSSTRGQVSRKAAGQAEAGAADHRRIASRAGGDRRSPAGRSCRSPLPSRRRAPPPRCRRRPPCRAADRARRRASRAASRPRSVDSRTCGNNRSISSRSSGAICSSNSSV